MQDDIEININTNGNGMQQYYNVSTIIGISSRRHSSQQFFTVAEIMAECMFDRTHIDPKQVGRIPHFFRSIESSRIVSLLLYTTGAPATDHATKLMLTLKG